MEAVGTLSDLVLDCPDPRALATFWGAVLGRRILTVEPGWVSLEPGGDGHLLSFQQVEDYRAPAWPGQDVPQQVHFDISVADLEPAADRVLALGAAQASAVLDPDGSPWQVFLDPVGHPFCLVTLPPPVPPPATG